AISPTWPHPASPSPPAGMVINTLPSCCWVPACPPTPAGRSPTSLPVPPTERQARTRKPLMDAQSYNAALADLRAVRDQIKKARAALAKLENDRARRIAQVASYEKAKAERIAPAAGLSVSDVVALVPSLAPDSLTAGNAEVPATA